MPRVETPPMTALRTAMDGMRLLYSAPIPPHVVDWAWRQEVLEFETPTGNIVCRSRGVDSDDGGELPDSLIWTGNDGVRLVARRPDRCDESAGQYHLDVIFQGLLCSSSRSGLEAIEGARASVERTFYPGVDVAAHTWPGMGDICTDVAVHADPEIGDAWIEREVFRNGHQDHAFGAFVTRTPPRKRRALATYAANDAKEAPRTDKAKMQGSQATGRTLTVGDDPKHMVYEKDKEILKHARDGDLVKARWRDAGWNGRDRVLRIENRFTRAWLGNNAIPTREGKKQLSRTTWEAFRRMLPYVGVELLARWRQIDRHDRKTRKHNRASSQLWETAWHHRYDWHAEVTADGWEGVGPIKAIQRAATRDRRTRTVENMLVDLACFVPEATLTLIATTIAESIERGESLYDGETLRKRQETLARRLGLPTPRDFRERRKAPLPVVLPAMERALGAWEAIGDAE